MIDTVIYGRGDLVTVSRPGIYHRRNRPRIGVVVDIFNDSYDGATILKVGFTAGGITNIILDGDKSIVVEILSRGRE